MNILHINQSDIEGGAAIGAYRLHNFLRTRGVNSHLLVGHSLTGSCYVENVPRMPRIENRLLPLAKRLGMNYINIVSSFFLIQRHEFFRSADVVNYHNLHTGYFNYLALPRLTQDKPAVLTLRDMWSFTGHCAYSFDCDRWKRGCGACPYMDTYPSVQKDNTRLEWKVKDKVFARSKLVVVAISSWLAERARESMLSRFSIHHIPSGIDTEIYRPLDKGNCRSLLGIQEGKPVIMFGAQSLKEERKGGYLLLQALQKLPKSLRDETVLITLGGDSEKFSSATGMYTIDLGYIGGDQMKTIAYSAADLFLFPTRAEAFGLVAQEALSCGTPIVSFNVGGVPDIVRHRITGYLAAPDDVRDFSSGIVELLEDRALLLQLGTACRQLALDEFSPDLQAKRYIELYEKVLCNDTE